MSTFIAPATFDYVCHPLKCLRCGETCSDDINGTDLQTKLREYPTMAILRVDDRLELRQDPRMGGYLVLHASREPLRVVEEWICDKCGTPFLWAILEVRDGILVSVEPIELDEATLENVDLVTGQVLFLFPTPATDELMALDPGELRARIAKAETERLAELARG